MKKGDEMNTKSSLYVTPKVRCLIYHERLTDDLYLQYCGIEQCLPDYYFDADGRDGYHLHVILQGKGKLFVDGNIKNLHFGQMFITKPGENTWYKADTNDPWVYCWMTFDGNIAKRCVEDAGFVEGINVLDCQTDPRHFHSIVASVLDQAELSPSNVYLSTGQLLRFISAAIHSYYATENRSRKNRKFPADDYVRYAADYIQANYATARITDVAKYVGLHRSYLTNLFKTKTGISPQEYLIQCRLQQGCKLLKETNNPIQEISHQIGYENPLTFSKTFKSVYGVSPREYRTKHQTDDKPKKREQKEI